MKIIFLRNPISDTDTVRLDELQKQAIQNGHSIINQNNGFIQNIISILTSRITDPNTIHVHGWNGALLLTLLRVFPSFDTPTIWTIERIPQLSGGFKKLVFNRFLNIMAASFTAVCVPTRTLQYRLLAEYEIKTFYIPDGYTEPILQDIQPREYGLRHNQYGVVLSQSIEEIEHIAHVYKITKSKKKLVIFSEQEPERLKKLMKLYPFITPMRLPLTSRGAISIVRAAGFVIMCDPAYSPLLLQAMDANRVIIATTEPLHEEILGTTGFYYHQEDTAYLGDLLAKATKDALLPKYSPSIRAKHHFMWEKAGLEYEQLYMRKQVKLVPFDSLMAKQAFHPAK